MKQALPPSSGPSDSDLYRRFQQWLGSSLGPQSSEREVVSAGVKTTHKRTRDEGRPDGLETFPTGLLAKDCVGVVGQHNSGGSHKQARGHAILGNVRTDVADYDWCTKFQVVLKATHYREVKRNCRQPLQNASSAANRVVSVSQDVQAALPEVAHASPGSVRDQLESQASRLRVSPAGSTGLGCGRAVPIVAGV